MLKNEFILRYALAGMFATILDTVVSYILFKIGQIEHDTATFEASILLPHDLPLNKVSARIVGILGHLTMGTIFGVSISLSLLYTGFGFPYVKGIGIGMVFWTILHRAIASKFFIKPTANVSSRSALIELAKHILMGFSVVLLSFWLFNL